MSTGSKVIYLLAPATILAAILDISNCSRISVWYPLDICCRGSKDLESSEREKYISRCRVCLSGDPTKLIRHNRDQRVVDWHGPYAVQQSGCSNTIAPVCRLINGPGLSRALVALTLFTCVDFIDFRRRSCHVVKGPSAVLCFACLA